MRNRRKSAMPCVIERIRGSNGQTDSDGTSSIFRVVGPKSRIDLGCLGLMWATYKAVGRLVGYGVANISTIKH